jgi:hypothetical protein
MKAALIGHSLHPVLASTASSLSASCAVDVAGDLSVIM